MKKVQTISGKCDKCGKTAIISDVHAGMKHRKCKGRWEKI